MIEGSEFPIVCRAAKSRVPSQFPSRALLEVENISKSFPGVHALQDVGLRLQAGEIVCVVGENGAGKSTLMKILGGVYTPDAGQIRIDGRPVHIGSVPEAQRLGVTLIHQELNLCGTLDVAANLFLGASRVGEAACG